MHYMYDNQGLPVLLVVVVMILVIAYCRMKADDTPQQLTRQADTAQGS